MNKDEALKLALEAFEWNYNTDLDNIPACEKWAKMLKENIAAIKEALAQPEQEPDDLTIAYMTGFHAGKNKDAPRREWVGLTEEDRNDCLVSADPCECLAKPESHQLMEDVETKLLEKNGG